MLAKGGTEKKVPSPKERESITAVELVVRHGRGSDKTIKGQRPRERVRVTRVEGE